MPAGELENVFRGRRAAKRPENFDLSTPGATPDNLTPRTARDLRNAAGRALRGGLSPDRHDRAVLKELPPWLQGRQGMVIGVGAFAIIAGACWLIFGQHVGNVDVDEPEQSGFPNLDKLYEDKLKNIAVGVSSLENLGVIVAKADETYEDVYHNQLVQHAKDSRDANEVDWNGFVQEARLTGPVFLAGKEKLREAVANMQRLIRRAPEYLRSMVQWLAKQNAEEASWYLSKVVKLVDSVHSSMEEAAERFANAETTIGGMSRDAKENADHFEHQATSLEGEVKALEGMPSVSTGRWQRSTNKALYSCQLEKTRTSLADCKMKCVDHSSGSCSRITYYATASHSNCYLHCDSATASNYREADTYILERAPAELAQEVTLKAQAAVTAVGLKARWRGVQNPLREVTRLVRRFRAATADLRGSLEDARFATDDLLAAFKPAEQASDAGVDKQLRMLERRVEEVVAAIEDLGDSLAVLRFQ